MNKLTFTHITSGSRTDFHRLMQMYAKELDEHQNRNTDPDILKRWTDSIVEKQYDDGRCLRLCYEKTELIGFLYGKIDLPDDKGFKKVGYGCIMEFYVLPKHRRKGYGKEMFCYMEEFFRAAGACRMYLTADPVTGRPFWETMGFIDTGTTSPDNGQEIYKKAVAEKEMINLS